MIFIVYLFSSDFSCLINLPPHFSDIYSIKQYQLVPIEICIQGGIIAANGLYNSFNVAPIQMIAVFSGIKREKKDLFRQRSKGKRQNTFAQELDKAMSKPQPEVNYAAYNAQSQLYSLSFTPHKGYTI